MKNPIVKELKMEQAFPIRSRAKGQDYQDIEDQAFVKELQRLVNTKLFRSARQFKQEFRSE